MRSKIARIFLTVFALLLIASPAFAQVYSFSLDREIVHVYWEEDGTLSLFYEMTFTNSDFADPIDFVDVGIPTSSFSLSNITANIDGRTIDHIAHSEYVSGAVELGLGSNAILPGRSGVVTMWATGIGNVLRLDSQDENYASAVFSPNWFDSQYAYGNTDITVVFHLPPGVGTNDGRWHSAPSGFPSEPFTELDSDGRVSYAWQSSTANPYTQYLFGASFPKEHVPTDAIYTPSIVDSIDFEGIFGAGIFCVIGLAFFGIPILAVLGSRKRKMQYLPPKIAIEGHGIKRGLTAIEAAVLLEEPFDKVLTMILFAVVKKNAASVVKHDPLKIELTDPQPKNLRKYETEFLEAFQESGKTKRKRQLQASMVSLVKAVTRKMKGFSRKETRQYYRAIVGKAWEQVEAADTPEVKSEKYDEVMEWTMLDKDYEDRTRDIFHHGPVIVPSWWGRYDPGYIRPTVSSPSTPSAPKSSGSLPSLPGSDFAASVVNGVENFSAGVIGSVREFTGGVTQKTNPPPVPSSTYRSGGGSSSCACACACAGCACACAGGGR
ncbi:MAG: hypothetical protein OEV06_06825 [Anaerolineae bacterium]|nr:hypothetical protein [Anaerolineae bacterium]